MNKTTLALSMQRRLRACLWTAACTMVAASLGAQSVSSRISSEIGNSEMTTLKGSLHPLAQVQFDAGRVPADTRLSGISIVFSRSAAQQADLDALIAAQQEPSSPLYHQWLTPDQFAARFGMVQSDLDKVETWLQQQGFSIDSVARSRNLIRFSGTAAQVELAFQTQMHFYKVNGQQHFAPSTELSLPASLASVVLAIRNLDDFRPKSHVLRGDPARQRPSFTSSQTGSVFFTPGDIATAYDIKPLYSASVNGAGQTIAIVGQSAVALSDIENFQKASLLTVKDPTLVLVPGTGSSTINPGGANAGDELESDLDLEWSGAIAPGATIAFVYTGSNTSYGVFDSIEYAIDEKIGNIVSASYGDCETDLGTVNAAALDSILQQAAVQGQSVISSSGDTGSTGCSGFTNLTTAQQKALAVSYPASSPYVTGLGGTEITAANDVSGNAYWAAKGSTDIVSSVLQYIPEVAWNDDSTSGLSSSGGGASALFTKPTWQTGVPGIPADGQRDVPDVALYSSPNYPGYLYCSSDTSTGVNGSCANGFRDANDQYLTVAGGTSFAAPIFAGMLAIVNQKAGYTSGQGLINKQLYTLAANSATYASAFHDVTTGNNDCLGGSSLCSSTAGFSAGVGYDQVTGLGSVDLNNLATAWPTSGSSLIGTTTTVSPTNAAPLVNVSDSFTVTVVSNTGSTVPSGAVSLIVDGGTPITGNTLLPNGTYVYTTSFATAGTHTVEAQYQGDATHAASSGVGSVTIAATSSGSGNFTLAASPSTLTVAQGSAGTETVTVTPKAGYTGTVLLLLSSSNDSALANLCYEFTTTLSNGDGSVAVTGASPVATQLTFDTNASDCAAAPRTIGTPLHRLGGTPAVRSSGPNPAPLALAFAGLLLAGFLGRSSRKFHGLAGLIALMAVALAVSACGGSSTSNTTVSNPPAGTYTITVTGQDSVTSTITASTTYTFVIQ
jgi:subtilase family serine protease